MKILCYDCFSGISGDMNLGAMIDLGIDSGFVINELNKLNVAGWELQVVRDQRHGISGTKVTVKQTKHEHAHRHIADIEKIINDSSLDNETKKLSLKIFSIVAEAEAKVHGIPVEQVHFHEVGAIDSIIDITGAAICFRALKADAVFVPAVELGGGMVRCDHGLLPVPAPATAEILKNITVKKDGVDFEATTPTGAAIIAAFGTHFGKVPEFRIEKTGYGIGQKENPAVPNILRVFLGEATTTTEGHDAVQIECNIDDMNPEFYDHISEKLFSAGASDVFLTNIFMKKGRPGNVINVICEPGKAEAVKEIIFTESTSLGIRTFPFKKDTLPRTYGIIKTIYGDVKVKRSSYKGKEVSVKPEYEDCKKIAGEKGIPVKEVYNIIMAAIVKGK
jgi:uncharacterized protein (TIGR00299 family) protein